jgi:hypothetical protein
LWGFNTFNILYTYSLPKSTYFLLPWSHGDIDSPPLHSGGPILKGLSGNWVFSRKV